jgi:acyl carrier protein
MNPDLNQHVPTREEILSTLIDIFNEESGENFKSNTADTIIDERYPDIDDLDRVDVIFEIEARFEIIMPDEEIYLEDPASVLSGLPTWEYKLKTIGEFADLVEKIIIAKQLEETGDQTHEGEEK